MSKITLRQANAKAASLYKTIGNLRGTVFELFRDCVDSWGDWDYNSNPVNKIMQGLKAEKRTAGWVWTLNKHLKEYTNLSLELKKDTGYIGLKKPKEAIRIEEGFYTNPLTVESEKKEVQKKPVEERVKKYLESALKELSKDDIKRILDSIA